MQNRQSLRLVGITIIMLAGNRCALAVEILPYVTVTAPRKPLAEQINNPQHLDEEDITVAHERTISDVLTGLPGITSSRTGGFGQVGPEQPEFQGGFKLGQPFATRFYPIDNPLECRSVTKRRVYPAVVSQLAERACHPRR